MENRKIRVGITHGDTNGIGYELILKAFSDSALAEMFVPIVYGSQKAFAFHRKALNLQVNYTAINRADEARSGCVNLLDCMDEDLPIALGQPTPESGRAACLALKKAVADYEEGLIDVMVTCPINKKNIYTDDFRFVGHTDFLEHEAGKGKEALMILLNSVMRVALVTTHLPLKDVAQAVTKEAVERKIQIFNDCLRTDFTISIPRIAVLSLNPHNGDEGLLGVEENDVITPAIASMRETGIECFGPYPADGFFGAELYKHFDGVLAMYHDQGLAPFKALSMADGVNFTAGLPIVRTSPDHGTAFDITGKGIADENSFRQAIYTAIDIFRNRVNDAEARVNPLKIVPPEKDSKTYSQKSNHSDVQ